MHLNRIQLAAALAAVAAYEFVTAMRIKRALREIDENAALREEINNILLAECHNLNGQLESANARLDYLLKKLDEHNVPATEFDLIVLNELT